MGAPITITVAEAAELLGITPSALYKLVDAGLVPHFRLGRRIRMRRDAIERFVEEGGAAYAGGWRREPAEVG